MGVSILKNNLIQKALDLISDKTAYEVSSLLKNKIIQAHEIVSRLFIVLGSENTKEGRELFEQLLSICYLMSELTGAEYPSFEEDIEPFIKNELSLLLLNDSTLSLMVAHRELGQLFLQFYLVYTGEEDKMDTEEVSDILMDIFSALTIVCQRLGLDPKKYF